MYYWTKKSAETWSRRASHKRGRASTWSSKLSLGKKRAEDLEIQVGGPGEAGASFWRVKTVVGERKEQA